MTAEQPRKLAVVAVHAPTHGGGSAYRADSIDGLFPGPVFHYLVPSTWSDPIVPGMLVQAPFGQRQVQGIVIDLVDTAPVAEIKLLTRILSAEPVLRPFQIELGLWLSEFYLTPMIDCLHLFLPPGLLREPHPVVRLHPETPIPADLPPLQQQAVHWVQQYGECTIAQLRRKLGRESAAQAVRALVRRGILIRSTALPPARVQPRQARFVRLLMSPPQVQRARQSLGRASPRAAILQALLDEPSAHPSVEHILSRADASPASLNALAQQDWVGVMPSRTWVRPGPTADPAALSRAPRQRAVLDHLSQQAAPMDEKELCRTVGASPTMLRAMQERGLVQRTVEPAAISLKLSEQKVRQKIIELRGASLQHHALDYLLTRPPYEWVWISWVYAETGCSLADLRALEEHGIIELTEQQVWRDPLAGRVLDPDEPPPLMDDQACAWADISAALAGRPGTFLLHGITGSGKTEIYLRAAQAVLEQGRQAIILVPEISLTAQAIERFSRRFATRFPGAMGIIHSRLSDGERYDTWRRIRAGHIRLVVGPRSALFAPFQDIGLIVLDEEHDASYKQDDVAPPYHARDVAIRLAQSHRAVVILGSATPDLTTLFRAREGGDIRLLQLSQRILNHSSAMPVTATTGELPPVRVVDMRHELRAGNRSMFSRPLQQELRRVLDAGEQAILFLNRRGAATFVLCRDCGLVLHCPRCDIPLTFHQYTGGLTCHHCGHQQAVPKTCPVCQSSRIRYFGVGTQRVQEVVQELLPQARLLRWDRDATQEKGSHEALLGQFARHEADILIGTQMIAKGFDLPLVTLVGVISADTALNLPDFRAGERTFQILVQVSGRAGRSGRGGQVIVQTYAPEHEAIQAAARYDQEGLYRREITFRRQMGYPPFSRLARLIFSDVSAARCRQQATQMAETLQAIIRQYLLPDIVMIGPAPCFWARLRGRWRWHIVVRATDPRDLLKHVRLGPGWRLDIDPVEML